ncbi:hypothetical protein BT93_L2995 [Corymbia citriodora subsp. variegata]|uniref:ENTH domain-containing protein n=1 Tax=Corymbia citriodora subsp. variegata TaxID=360336 RepID=A0A8T0CIG3_CORYI|nr:hypothetical protein BT93_L2995 [Corymbia citriodora subsp. variegata]
MSPSTIRKTLGVVKDHTSIGLAKVASNMAPELEVNIAKATSHDDDPVDEKYIRRILNLASYQRGYVHACWLSIDYMVALKSLVVIHRLLNDGDPIFHEEIMYATRREMGHHSAFLRTYAINLDQRLELILSDRRSGGDRGGPGGSANGGGSVHSEDRYGSRDDFRSPQPKGNDYDYGDYRGEYDNYGGMRRSRSYRDMNDVLAVKEGKEERRVTTPLREMKPERIFGKMGHLQRLLDRFLACRPTGLAKNSRLILVALYPVVKESFRVYADICEILPVLLDKFFDMAYHDCVEAFDAYASATKQIDELSSEYPEVQRINSKLLETLEEFVRDRAKRPKSPERREELPVAQEEEPPKPEPPKPQVTGDLVDLRDNRVTVDDQGNKFALALFLGPPANTGNGSWEAFPSNGEPSAWQTRAAESGKEDWELALVETASDSSKQKSALGGGLDPLLLNGMYDQGMVRQHVSTAQLTGGSASSVALPGLGKSETPVLALPAPDGTVQTVNQDPFAASLSIPPPSYHLVVQEQQLWQKYATEGMRGQATLAKIGGPGYYTPGPPSLPYGMPPVNGMGPPTGYYYSPY